MRITALHPLTAALSVSGGKRWKLLLRIRRKGHMGKGLLDDVLRIAGNALADTLSAALPTNEWDKMFTSFPPSPRDRHESVTEEEPYLRRPQPSEDDDSDDGDEDTGTSSSPLPAFNERVELRKPNTPSAQTGVKAESQGSVVETIIGVGALLFIGAAIIGAFDDSKKERPRRSSKKKTPTWVPPAPTPILTSMREDGVRMVLIQKGRDTGWCRCQYCDALMIPDELKYIEHVANCSRRPCRKD